MMIQIEIDQLENVIISLLNRFKIEIGNVIEIHKDYYWDISSDELYEPYTEPKDIGLGQISDDVKEIQRLFEPTDDMFPFDLKRVAAILRVISDENLGAF